MCLFVQTSTEAQRRQQDSMDGLTVSMY